MTENDYNKTNTKSTHFTKQAIQNRTDCEQPVFLIGNVLWVFINNN